MGQIRGERPYAALMDEMAADCSRCRGLCCTELYFSRCDGFPADKAAGVPCGHLTAGFRCDIHGEFAERGAGTSPASSAGGRCAGIWRRRPR